MTAIGISLSRQHLSAAARSLLIDLLTGHAAKVGAGAAELAQRGWTASGVLRADAAALLGCDVGGTKVHSVLADLQGRCLAELHEPTDPAGGAALVAQILRHRDHLRAKAGNVPLMAACIGIPGAVHPKSGHVSRMPNIAGLRDTDLASLLTGALDLPTAVENDVNLAALGEYWLGHRADSLAFLALGTGIGLGQLVNGQILRGASGAAGEVAVLPIGASAFDPRTFQAGALESTVGAASLVAAYEAQGGWPGQTLRDLFATGDPHFSGVLDGLVERLAQAVLSVAAITDPEIVVFGGSVGQRPDLVARVAECLAQLPFPMPECRTSRLGNRAGVLGAVWLARQRLAIHLRKG
ncbi:MAG: ROK family protein [Paracoccaceae bacterium]